MSSSYTHLLIPVSKDLVPTPDAVCLFLEGIVQAGTVAAGAAMKFAVVSKGQPAIREMRNPMTGETLTMRGPSRRRQKPQQLSSPSEIITLARDASEYDVAIIGEGIPKNPPLAVGYIRDDGVWKAMDEPYHLEIGCRMRASLVRLHLLRSEEDLHRPPDFANAGPRFGEDCTLDERDGLFVDPETGKAVRVANAGCGKFWIEFCYGNWIFPKSDGRGLPNLAPVALDLATQVFGTPFAQGCLWG